MKINYLFLASALVISLFSCKKDEPLSDADQDLGSTYEHGKLISCEGSFGNNNASVSWIGSAEGHVNNVFQASNGFGLGDILQSISVIGDEAFLVVNNSQKVEVVDLTKFEIVGTITGIDYPRFMIPVSDNQAYLTNGSIAGAVYVVDLSTLEVLGSIPVGNGPEMMVMVDDQVFVANSGGWDYDNTLSVIDVYSQTVVGSVEVGDRPTSIIEDNDGMLWVMCSGDVYYDENWTISDETQAQLIKVNPASLEVVLTVNIGEIGDHPSEICFDKVNNRVLVAFDGIRSVDAEGNLSQFTSLDCSSILVDDISGDVFATSVSDFVNPSTVFHLSSAGELLAEISVGIGANQIVQY
jgi:hypothetical protein